MVPLVVLVVLVAEELEELTVVQEQLGKVTRVETQQLLEMTHSILVMVAVALVALVEAQQILLLLEHLVELV
jgi:hypothetical protein